MTRVQRRLLFRTAQLGLLLTLGVLLADRLGLLAPMERYLYDLRARHCQRFVPPPSDQIVHLDIDDQSVQQIGRWPWPRSVLAEVLEEVHLAGPKVIALDILLDQAERTEAVADESGKLRWIDHDQILADAIARCGNVLVPVSINFERLESASSLHATLVELLKEDLERDAKDLEPLLRARGFNQTDVRLAQHEKFLPAAEQAAFERIEAELSNNPRWSLDEVESRLTPRGVAADERTNARVLVQNIYPIVQAVLRMREFGAPLPENFNALVGRPREATIPVLANVATHVGFVDFIPTRDGTVRSLPLAADYRGRLLPHMALAVACAILNVDPRSIQYGEEQVIIPLRGGDSIVIPVRTLWSRQLGTARLIMDIPFLGDSEWLTMYDYPGHSQPKQHEPLRNVWRIREIVHSVEKNHRLIYEAMQYLHVRIGAEELAKFEGTWPLMEEEQRRELIDKTLRDEMIVQYIEMYNQMPPDQIDEAGRRFVASYRAAQQIPRLNEFLAGRLAQDRAKLRKLVQGKAVLIGWAQTGGTDTYPTSLHYSCPGVAIQGAVVNAILTRNFRIMSPWWIGALITLLVGAAATAVVAFLPARRAMLITLLLISSYLVFNGFVLFDYADRVVNAAAPIAAGVLVWSGLTLARNVYETAERARITRRFSSYVDPAVVNYYLEHPERVRLEGQVKEMTVVFTDLAGFTTLSETLRERTVPLLNEYMSLMLPIIRENRGRWNKFLGDGIMFYFNAPDDNPHHAADAVRTALQMQRAVSGFNERLIRDGLPQVSMRAGISSGMMVVGDAGSTDPKHHASDYTVLGDEVNLAARLESANKALGTRILLSSRTVALIGDDFLVRPVGCVRVVGKTTGVQIYEALCARSEADNEKIQLAGLSRDLVDRFRAAQFDPCIQLAREIEQRFGQTRFTQLYMSLSQRYLSDPPSNGFDGQIVLEEK